MGIIEPYKGIAGIYEEIRPSYPEEMIQDIIKKANLSPEDKLLEIGPGTGKATVQFAGKGFYIHGIESGEDMAEILKDKCLAYPKVSVEVIPFEDWSCPEGVKYDFIYCAQAFHWIDKSIKYKKCYGLLKDNGYLALFWYSPDNEKSPLAKEIDEKVNRIIGKYISGFHTNNVKPERRAHDGVSDNDERKEEIEASGLFEVIEKAEYTYEILNNARQYLLAMKSVPAFASVLDGLDTEAIEKMDNEIINVINSYGGYVGGMFRYTLYLCKKLELCEGKTNEKGI